MITALVDYDNVRPLREHTRLDAQANLKAIVDKCVQIAVKIVPDLDELRLRLYGGWVDDVGH
jgi:hypothetical protein